MEKGKFEGKLVIITGGSSGLGKALAQRLIENRAIAFNSVDISPAGLGNRLI